MLLSECQQGCVDTVVMGSRSSAMSSCARSRALTALLSLCVLVGVPTCATAGGGSDSSIAKAEAATMPHLDLSKATIKPKLSALPADDAVLLEFFASWCPACRCEVVAETELCLCVSVARPGL